MVNNAADTGAGTINDTGLGSYLYFDNTQTFNNATINLGNASGIQLLEYDLTGAGTVLTLGSNVTIDESGSAYIETVATQATASSIKEYQPDGKRQHSLHVRQFSPTAARSRALRAAAR